MDSAYQNINNAPYAPAPQAAVKKPALKFTKTDYVFAALFGISSLLMAFIGVTEGFALGYTLSHSILVLITFIYVLKGGKASFLSGFATRWYIPFVVVSVSALFIGLIVRVVRNIILQAIIIKNENDLTI